jgi:hypothetical protein
MGVSMSHIVTVQASQHQSRQGDDARCVANAEKQVDL